MLRSLAASLFAGLLIVALRVGSGMNEREAAELRQFESARDGIRAIAGQGEGLFTDDERAQLDAQVNTLQQSLNFWSTAKEGDRDIVALAKRNCFGALTRAQWLIDSAAHVVRVSVGGSQPAEAHAALPYGPGVVLLRVSQPAAAPGQVPGFVRGKAGADIRLSPMQTSYVLLSVANPQPGVSRIPLRMIDASGGATTANLTVDAPSTGTLHVRVIDGETQQGVPAVIGVYGRDDHLFVPEDGISFDDGGFYYSSGRVRGNREVRYWPGRPDQHRVFFSSGEFSLKVPAGKYTVIAGKGMEFLPVSESVEVKAGADESRTVSLKRWIDMPARGWYSGDMHVHWARASEAANVPLLRWIQAEDVHVASVLRMGDAKQTYFEQYGFGKPGQVVAGKYAIVPGQEDPRTNIIGHTLHLKLQATVRDPERYYLYNLIFDQVARQGGLNGYAHMQQPDAMGFFVRRDMTMEVPRGKTDFFEVCEFGNIGLETYYEFLNLGFPLAVAAGSDVPWGNTVGTSRVYAYTGKDFSPDAWFDALKAGHTFVTAGPMLEFTVNGQLPGSVIQARHGDRLQIKAVVEGGPVAANYLEVVEQGGVVRSATGEARRLSAEFEMPVTHSTWIAARCSNGHTTPVYVKVGDERFWKRSEVPHLIANRLDELRQVEDVMREGMSESHLGNWDNPQALTKFRDAMQKRIEESRTFYNGLLEQARKERVQ